MQCRCLCRFHQFSMFCLCSNLSPCNFCLLVVQLLMRFCFFRKNFQYAVARCVGYFSTTFCAEMQCRCFFAVLISFQCFVCAVIFHRVIFVCSLCSCSCDFVSFVKIFNMQLQGVLGIFQQRFVQKCNVGVSLQFSSVFNVFCAVIFHRVIFVCSLCSCSCDFVFHGSFCVFVCKLSGRLSGKVPRQGSLLVSTVCLA